MINLPRQTTFAGLEQFLRDIRQSPGQGLKLPMQVSHGGAFSFSAVAVQGIATWACLHEGKRRTPTGTEPGPSREPPLYLIGQSHLAYSTPDQ